jgi:hypothetical protein
MTDVINARGFRFNVEQSGFVANDAVGDFHEITAKIQDELRHLPVNAVALLHTEAGFEKLDALASAICSRHIKDWRNPAEAFVMISPA